MNKNTIMQLVIGATISVVIIGVFKITTFAGMFLAAGLTSFLVTVGFGLAAIRKENTTNR